MESNSGEISNAYKTSKSKVLEKLQESIASEQIEIEGSAISVAVEKLLKNDVGHPSKDIELIGKMDKMIKINKNHIWQ